MPLIESMGPKEEKGMKVRSKRRREERVGADLAIATSCSLVAPVDDLSSVYKTTKYIIKWVLEKTQQLDIKRIRTKRWKRGSHLGEDRREN